MYKIFLFSMAVLSASFSKSAGVDLSPTVSLFQGDWFENFEDPQDSRFITQGIDLKKYFEEATPLREKLYKIREKYALLFNEIENDKNADFIELSKNLTKDLIKFTSTFIKDALPPNVSEKDMAFIAFGSMARGESGIVTDIEGSLLWDPSVKARESLGMAFGQKLANDLDGLLGHPIYGFKGFRLDEAEISPFHKAPYARLMNESESFCSALRSLPVKNESRAQTSFRNGYFYPFEGSLLYTRSTPEELANFINIGNLSDWPSIFNIVVDEETKKGRWYEFASPFLNTELFKASSIEKILANSSCARSLPDEQLLADAQAISTKMQKNEIASMGNFPLVSRNRTFVFGNENLLSELNERRNEILNENNQSLRRKLALRFLKSLVHFITYQTGTSFITGKAPDVVDIKRYNYRLDEQIHTNFALLFNLEVQNQGDIIRALVKRGFFGENYGRKALARVNQEIRLRWRKQIKLQSQLEKNMQFLTKEAWDNKIVAMRNEIKKYEKVLEDEKQRKEIEVLMAKRNIALLKQDLKLVIKSEPGRSDSIFRPQEIAYIRDYLYPEQAEVFKRLLAYLGREADPKIAPNADAFKDSFDPSQVNAEDYLKP